MRASRLWFDKNIVTTKRWCDAEARDCIAICSRVLPEKDSRELSTTNLALVPRAPRLL